jgi:hypothetical protein
LTAGCLDFVRNKGNGAITFADGGDDHKKRITLSDDSGKPAED